MKTAPVKMFRASPPFFKTFTVGQITVRGVLDLLRRFGDRNELRFLASEAPVLGSDIWAAANDPSIVTAFADEIVLGQPAGFFKKWMSQSNLVRLLKAATNHGALHGPNDWGKVTRCLNLSGEPRRQGSVMGDIIAICQIIPGLSPEIVLAMPMEDFLDLCDGLKPDEPDPTIATSRELSAIPGLGVVH